MTAVDYWFAKAPAQTQTRPGRRPPVTRTNLEANAITLGGGYGTAGRTVYGLAVPYGVPTRISNPTEGTFTEEFVAGSLSKTIREKGSRLPLLVQHSRDPTFGSLPVGRFLQFKESQRGVEFEAELFDGENASRLIQPLRSNLMGMSVSFRPILEDWLPKSNRSGGLQHRRIREAALTEISIVTFAAYPTTTAGIRSFAADVQQGVRRHSQSNERKRWSWQLSS